MRVVVRAGRVVGFRNGGFVGKQGQLLHELRPGADTNRTPVYYYPDIIDSNFIRV